MQPQGTALLNASYFTAATNQINAITTQINGVRSQAQLQAELQLLTNTVIADMQAQAQAITQQIGLLQPAFALLSVNPANLPQVITFCQGLITHFLTPQLAPYTNYVAQAAALVTQVNSLISAIQSAAVLLILYYVIRKMSKCCGGAGAASCCQPQTTH